MVKAVENFGLQGPVERWRGVRAKIHDEVCRHGFDRERNTFVQYYGGTELDASLLMIALVGFLPPGDPVDARFSHVLTLRDGRVASLEQITDTRSWSAA